MAYPADLSNLPANRTDWTGTPATAPDTAKITAATVNAIESAINAIEATLGLTPQGTIGTGTGATTVAARLAAIDTALANAGVADGSITAAKLAAAAVTAAKLATGAVGTTAIADGAVTAAKVAADVATQAELDAVSALLAGKLGTGPGAVGTSNLADGSVTAAKVAADVATQAELDAVAAVAAGKADGAATTAALAARAPLTAVTAALGTPSTATTGTLVAGQMALVDATSAAIARTLPAANTVAAGTVTGVKKIDSSGNAVTVSRAGSDTITGTATGQTSRALTLAGESVEFTSDGVSVWVITSTDTPSPALNATYVPWATLAGQPTQGVSTSSLPNWYKKLASDPTNAKIVFIGDSTSDEGVAETAAMYLRLRTTHTQPGEALEGMQSANFVSRGVNGITRATYFGTPSRIDTVVADAPHLIVYSLGINDARGGSIDAATLQAGITSDVNTLRTRLPNTDIVLRMPNSFTTDDVNGNGFVTPNTAPGAQAATDVIFNAYTALASTWSNVVLWDSQTDLFGRTCVARTTNYPYMMKDQLHPSQALGYPLIADRLAPVLGRPRSYIVREDPCVMSAARGALPYTFGDLVDRADSTTSVGTATSGQAWTTTVGTAGILGNRIYAPNSSLFRGVASAGVADGEFGITLSTFTSTDTEAGLAFRHQDGSNFMIFRGVSTGYELLRVFSGVTTLVSTRGPAPRNGDRIKVICRGSSMKCYVNNYLICNVTETNLLTGASFGFHGLGAGIRFALPYARRLAV